MPKEVAHGEFMSFMAEYTGFLAQMRADEKDKMTALGDRILTDIEHGIAKSQANAKHLANYEQKRIAMQEAAGYGGMTFRQLIDAAPPDTRDGLQRLLGEFERYVSDIRFFNDKSMAIARDNMVEIDPQAVLSGGGEPQNPYEKLRRRQTGGGLLETKV